MHRLSILLAAFTFASQALGQTGWDSPDRRIGAGSAYDTARNTQVVFGGSSGAQLLGDTWERETGNNWSLASSGGGLNDPSARRDHTMVYDPVTKKVVMHGGTNASNQRQTDTWEWDQGGWGRLNGVAAGPEASGHAAVWDTGNNRMLIFGGENQSGLSNETWQYKARVWTKLNPATPPTPRVHAAMAYDSVRKEVILFGGRDQNGDLDDTWRFDGTNWAKITIPSTKLTPLPRSRHVMSYHPPTARILMVGGNHAFMVPNGGHYEWNGSEWAFLYFNGAPQHFVRLDGATLIYDENRKVTVLHGGQADDPSLTNELFVEPYEWNGTNWTTPPDLQRPRPRSNPAMAYDSDRRRLVVANGYYDALRIAPGTYEFDGVRFYQLNPGTEPSVAEAGMGYDPTRKVCVLFGGFDTGLSIVDRTWEWNGTAWTQKTPTTRPPARLRGQVVWDTRNNRLLLVGGESSFSGQGVFDVWTWNGTAWTQVTLPSSPAPSTWIGRVAYDSFRGVLVSQTATGTYEWDGTSVAKRSPTTSPGVVRSMAYDPLCRTTVAYRDGGNRTAEMWEWNGTEWRTAGLGGAPEYRDGEVVFVGAVGRVALFGGVVTTPISLRNAFTNEMWFYGLARLGLSKDRYIGPGGYSSFAAAVTAAEPGDRILLGQDAFVSSWGDYVIDKKLTIESFGGRHKLTIRAVDYPPGPNLRCIFKQPVVFRDLDIEVSDGSTFLESYLVFDVAAGDVQFDRVAINQTRLLGFGPRAVVDIRAGEVLLRSTTVTVGDSVDGFGFGGIDALKVTADRLVVEDGALHAGSAGNNSSPTQPGRGGAALLATTRETLLVRCELQNGNGSYYANGSSRSLFSAAGTSTLGTVVSAYAARLAPGLAGSDPSLPTTSRGTPTKLGQAEAPLSVTGSALGNVAVFEAKLPQSASYNTLGFYLGIGFSRFPTPLGDIWTNPLLTIPMVSGGKFTVPVNCVDLDLHLVVQAVIGLPVRIGNPSFVKVHR
ncbi:MAG: hypothetical protein KDC87_00715 [Planctomycetes bacterium]|nr:hypothetical protein [Planctomycetota bacterium]